MIYGQCRGARFGNAFASKKIDRKAQALFDRDKSRHDVEDSAFRGPFTPDELGHIFKIHVSDRAIERP